MIAVLALIGNLLAAAVLGGAIGVQRQASHKPAGFRTHLLVALGACAFMEVSRLLGDTRIAAGVITGVGFLGAGSIARVGLVPHGLTTAASIWSVAAIGLAAGVGTGPAYGVALAGTMFTFVALSISDTHINRFIPTRGETRIVVIFDVALRSLADVTLMFERAGTHVRLGDAITVAREGEQTKMTAVFELSAKEKYDMLAIVAQAASTPGILKLEIAGDETIG